MPKSRSHLCLLTLILALTVLMAGVVEAQEPLDVPADVVELLGATPDLADDLRVVVEKPAREDANVPVVLRVWMAHAAEDRYVWALEFDREFPRVGTTALLYLDGDNNPRSGRQDKPEVVGTDVQYSTSGSRTSASVKNSAVYADGASPARGMVRGNILWIADDITLFTADGQAQVRLRTLVQGPGGGDGCDWLPASVPVNEGRTKPALPSADRLSFKGLLREEVEPAPDQRELP